MKLNKIMLINMLVTLGFISSCNGGSSKSDQVNSNSLTPSATKPQNSLVIKNGVPVRSFELNGLIPLIKVKTRRGYHLCTGVVVAPNKILTAAHCVMKLHDKVVDQYFESQDLYAAKKIVVIFPKEVDRPINLTIDSRKNWIRYKARVVYVKSDVFTGASISNQAISVHDYSRINDLAIIELSDSPRFGYHIELANAAPQVNEEQIVAGFGHNTGDNNKAKEQSHGNAGILRMGKTIVTQIDNPSILKIGVPITNDTPNIATCTGDSGSPSLVYNSESSFNYTLTGITSLSYGERMCSFLPSVYMSIAYYKDWIESGYLTDSLTIGKSPKK